MWNPWPLTTLTRKTLAESPAISSTVPALSRSGSPDRLRDSTLWSLRMGMGSNGSSSPGEFHPEALTDPYVNLSIHTAPRSHALASCEACLLWKKRLILVNQLAKPSVELRHPLRSTPITGASTLLLDDPSSADASL